MTADGDEMVRRVRAALAEAGYPNARVESDIDGPSIGLGQRADEGEVPERVAWRAHVVAGNDASCWACWNLGYDPGCLQGSVEDCGLDRMAVDVR